MQFHKSTDTVDSWCKARTNYNEHGSTNPRPNHGGEGSSGGWAQ